MAETEFAEEEDSPLVLLISQCRMNGRIFLSDTFGIESAFSFLK